MSTLTKEWLQRTIAELEVERDSVPGAVNEDAAMALAAMKLARASLEAEPIGASHIADEQATHHAKLCWAAMIAAAPKLLPSTSSEE
ncbi:TPA: hypothetical protein ACYEMU_002681 [Enterobacter hormaechei]